MKKVANADTNATVLSLHAAPIATPTTFCSAINPSINLVGSTALIFSAYVEFFVSPSRATTRGLFFAS